MSDPEYRISVQWKDTVVYEEGDRSLRFDGGSMSEPVHVSVPAAEVWSRRVPAWASERRAVIVERLRAAGMVVEEDGDGYRAVTSPDGAVRVIEERGEVTVDERGAIHDGRRVRLI